MENFAAKFYLNSLGALRSKQGRFDDALALLTLALRERERGPDNSQVAETLNDLGLAYSGQGTYAKAEESYTRALAIRRKLLAPDGRPS